MAPTDVDGYSGQTLLPLSLWEREFDPDPRDEDEGEGDEPLSDGGSARISAAWRPLLGWYTCGLADDAAGVDAAGGRVLNKAGRPASDR